KLEADLAGGGAPAPQEHLPVDPLRLGVPRRKSHPLGVPAAPEPVGLEREFDLVRALGEVLQVLLAEARDPSDALPSGAAVLVALDLVAKREKLAAKVGLVDLVREPLRPEDPPRVDRAPLAVRTAGDVEHDA